MCNHMLAFGYVIGYNDYYSIKRKCHHGKFARTIPLRQRVKAQGNECMCIDGVIEKNGITFSMKINSDS